MQSSVLMPMEVVEKRNRLQKRAPPPLKVQAPPPDLFMKSTPIPLLSPLFCESGAEIEKPHCAVAQENENGRSGAVTGHRACMFANLGAEGWQLPAAPGLFGDMHTPLFAVKLML
ncbi:hypothetical protein SUGI_0858240 [Cryptomeria japonica]|uniref:uncharacterized protein LOC131066286 n=1 Tax=Cryptomeria japonica TaxID=3369 RepID=UPI0024149C09|nr:uncharacterized protein LOC131066286 [Cryptomeria japonica]GLJ41471.1 hypothetical protein SUGI_0858240 [Cryptomeria japonica]